MQDFKRLVTMVRRLRSPTGCPWDRAQTLETIFTCLTSEIKETKQAITAKDWDNLEEELGDLLLNIVLIVQIGSEDHRLSMSRLLKRINRKIITRHTWVFGKDRAKVKTAEDALSLWRENKEKLKQKKLTTKKKTL